MTKPALMIGLGEVLWDLLPSGRVLGGAPANFAYMTCILGDQGIVASRVGRDDPGIEAIRLLRERGVDTSFIQEDGEHETGSAGVSIDEGGQPTFTIKESVSWDFLHWTKEWKVLSAQTDVVCFGSLAQRSEMSSATIQCFLRNTRSDSLRICDVNLRQFFYSPDVLRKSFRNAHIVKLNDQEMIRVATMLGLNSGTEESLARDLLNNFDLRLVCVTRGAHGSLLVSPDKTVQHKGFDVKVADAVGAGDAFTACLAHHYIRGSSLEDTSEAANRFASWVATQVGAMPLVDRAQSQEILKGVTSELARRIIWEQV